MLLTFLSGIECASSCKAKYDMKWQVAGYKVIFKLAAMTRVPPYQLVYAVFFEVFVL